MTTQEIAKLVYVTKAAYPRYYEKFTKKDFDNVIAVWEMVLDKYSYQEASEGLKVYIASDTKGFPPAPGQIIDCITKITAPVDHSMLADEAWALVDKAVRNSNYNAEQEFEKLPDICKEVVRSPGVLKEYAMMDLDEYQNVQKGYFLKAYNALIERKRSEAKLPGSVQVFISAANQKAIEEKL